MLLNFNNGIDQPYTGASRVKSKRGRDEVKKRALAVEPKARPRTPFFSAEGDHIDRPHEIVERHVGPGCADTIVQVIIQLLLGTILAGRRFAVST